MNKKEREDLLKLAQRATPGPWYFAGSGSEDESLTPMGTAPDVVVYDDTPGELASIIDDLLDDHNCEFIASSREAVPDLIAWGEKLLTLLQEVDAADDKALAELKALSPTLGDMSNTESARLRKRIKAALEESK